MAENARERLWKMLVEFWPELDRWLARIAGRLDDDQRYEVLTEVIDDVLIRLIKRPHRVSIKTLVDRNPEAVRRVRNLLFAAVRNRGITRSRRVGREQEKLATYAPTADPTIRPTGMSSIECDEFHAIVSKTLTCKCTAMEREAFQFRYEDEHSLNDIALKLGASVNSTKKSIRRAKAKLQSALFMKGWEHA